MHQYIPLKLNSTNPFVCLSKAIQGGYELLMVLFTFPTKFYVGNIGGND